MKPRIRKLATASPVWADIMARDFEKIQWIIRETDPGLMADINKSLEKIADIVDVYIGENLEGKYYPDEKR